MFESIPTTHSPLVVSMAAVTPYVVMRIVHLTTAGVWAGWTVFMAALVVPAARDGRLGTDAVRWLTRRFTWLSMVAPLVMFLTGMYMVVQGYPPGVLLSSTRGYFVLTMIGLWIVLSVTTNVSGRRLTGRIDARGSKWAANTSSSLFTVAGVVAIALLLVGGWL